MKAISATNFSLFMLCGGWSPHSNTRVLGLHVLVIFSIIESMWNIASWLKPSLSKVLRWATMRFGEKLSMVEMVSEQIAVSNFLMFEMFSIGLTMFIRFWNDRAPSFSMITAVL